MTEPNTNSLTTSTDTTTTNSSPTEANTATPTSLPSSTTQERPSQANSHSAAPALAGTALPLHTRPATQPSNPHLGGVEMQRSYARCGNTGGRPIAVTSALYVPPPYRPTNIQMQVGEASARDGGSDQGFGHVNPCDCHPCHEESARRGGV